MDDDTVASETDAQVGDEGFESPTTPAPERADGDTPVRVDEGLAARLREAAAHNRAARTTASRVDPPGRTVTGTLANTLSLSKSLQTVLGLRQQFDTYDRLTKLTAGPDTTRFGLVTPSATSIVLGGPRSPLYKAIPDAATFPSRRHPALGIHDVVKGNKLSNGHAKTVLAATTEAHAMLGLTQLATSRAGAHSSLVSLHRSPGYQAAFGGLARYMAGGGPTAQCSRDVAAGLGVWNGDAARLRGVLGRGSLIDNSVWKSAGLLGEQPWWSKLNLTGSLSALYDQAAALQRLDQFLRSPTGGMKALQELLEETADEKFERMWDGTPLSYLMFSLSLTTVKTLMGLPGNLREAVVIEAVAQTLSAGTYLPWLRQAVRSAPYLHEDQREVLEEALAYIERDKWNLAVRLLLNGFEGAMVSALCVTDGYTELGNGHVVAMEKLMNSSVFADDFRMFVKNRMYSQHGNPFRHGRTPPGARQQTVIGIIGLAGWLDHFANADALDRLVDHIDVHLDAATAVVVAAAP